MAAATAVAATVGDKVGFWRRTGAYLIDIVGLIILGLILATLTGQGSAFTSTGPSGLDFVIDTVYFIGLWTYWNGQTLGMKALGIRVVKTDGSPLTLSTSIIRYVGLFISFLCLAIGVIWVAFDPNKQGWHDKIAGTYVVRAAA
jgi:uncharacterized RDD family membrane protein YckC